MQRLSWIALSYEAFVIQHGADGIAEDAFESGAALITADAVPALDDETFRIAEAVYNKNSLYKIYNLWIWGGSF